MSKDLPVVTLSILNTPQQFIWDEHKREFRPVAGGPRLPLAVAILGASVGWLKGLEIGSPAEATGCANGCQLCGG